MTALTHVLHAAEPVLPMTIVGWSVLLVSLLITVGWLTSLYR